MVDQYGADGYLVSAAPADMWPTALCAELFSTGVIASMDLFEFRFPRGRPVWDWLLEGGYGHYPREVPTEIAVREVASVPVTFGTLDWEIRAVRVSPVSAASPSNMAGQTAFDRRAQRTHLRSRTRDMTKPLARQVASACRNRCLVRARLPS